MLESQDSSSDKLPEGFVISNRYEIANRLGAGGMGCVYLAKDKVLEDSQVAIKVLHRELCKDGDIAKRFLREVKLMHQVNHANVVRTFDVGRDKDIIYFTMEYLSGSSLDRIVHRKQLDLPTIVQITTQVCSALQAIHSAEIVHRDLKPGNIIVLPDKTVKLTDFGVARPKGSNLTQHNEIIGSVEYMAPEVWLGKGMTPAIDFYSLGVILYQLVTGQVPFESDEPATLMWMHVKKPPAPPKSIREDIPAWLNNMILKLLAKTPTDRPKTAAEILTYFERHASRGRGSGQHPTTASTGSFAVASSGSFQVGSSSGNYPQTTRTTIRRPTTRPRKKTFKDLFPAIVLGTLIVGITVVFLDRFINLLTDLFPY